MYVPRVLPPALTAVEAAGGVFRSEGGRRTVVIRREKLSCQVSRNRGHLRFRVAPVLWMVDRLRPPFGEEHTRQQVSELILVAGPELVEMDAINAWAGGLLNNLAAHRPRTRRLSAGSA